MTPHEFKSLLDRYSAGKSTAEEKETVDTWFENIQHTDEKSAVAGSIEDRLWSKIRPVKKMQTSYQLLYKIAASVALIIAVAGIWQYNFANDELKEKVQSKTDSPVTGSSVYYLNTKSTSQKLALEDGSVVILEPGSSITYPSRFETEKRIVSLSGEGFFNVKRDPSRPFYVYSNEIITKVLGTSFKIKAYDSEKEIIVSVKTGKVSVSPNPVKQKYRSSDVNDVILTPNQQVVYNRDAEIVSKQIVPVPAVVAERSNIFAMQFDGKPVTEIFEILEENYGIEIQYDKDILDGCILTTTMTEEGFYERIKIICKAINAEYTTIDAVLIIKSEGCK